MVFIMHMDKYFIQGVALNFLASCVLIAFSLSVNADEKPLNEYMKLSFQELLTLDLTTASHTPQSILDSPYTISVITEDEIKNSGARDIFDLIKHVPGLQIAITNRGRPVVNLRGISRPTSNYVLFLLNGHRLNEPANGSATFHVGLANLPVHNIKRIEVVRGPGSSVYGTGAFLGVVNVITYNANEINGVEATLRHERDETGSIGEEYNILVGHSFNSETNLALNLNVKDYEGDKRRVKQDLFGNRNQADTEFDQYDFQGEFNFGHLNIKTRATHQSRGEYAGALFVPDDENQLKYDAAYIDIKYNDKISRHIDGTLGFYADYIEGTSRLVSRPALSTLLGRRIDSNTDDLSLEVSKIGADGKLVFSYFDDHLLTFGVQFEHQSQNDLKHKTNSILPIGTYHPLVDVTKSDPFGIDASREVYALFVEDSWGVFETVNVNMGVRYDYYTDFGSTINPRFGIKWNFVKDWNLRFTYGTAFRAPDFRSLYLVSPSSSGNKNLQEEHIETFEVGLSGNPIKNLRTEVTLFRNELDDMIAVQSGTFQNLQQMKSKGWSWI